MSTCKEDFCGRHNKRFRIGTGCPECAVVADLCCSCGKPLFSDNPDCRFPGNHRGAPKTELEVRKDERERCAWLLQQMYNEERPGPARAMLILAMNTLRRGRLLTDKEKLENLWAAIHDKPVPHPAPETAQ